MAGCGNAPTFQFQPFALKTTPSLPTPPLALMCAALGMLAVPLWEHAASWCVVLFVATLLGRVGLNILGLPLPRMWLKLSGLAVCAGVIWVQYGTVAAVEPAFGILLILIALKVSEARRERDWQVLTLLGLFLGLCDLFFEQDLGRWLYIGAAYVLVLTARMQAFHPTARHGLRRAGWQAVRLLGQALPLTVLFFFFFPRVYGDFRLAFGGSLLGPTLSDKLAPGSLSSLALRTDPAFSVKFPDGYAPPASEMYWRGIVLWDGTGLYWERGGPGRQLERPTVLEGPGIRQQIILEPYGESWLFALDRPASPVPHALYDSGGSLRRVRPIHARLAYEVISRPRNREMLPEGEMEETAALRVPARVSPAVRALAASWKAGGGDNEAITRRGLLWFRTHGFLYSLSPGAYDSPELDEFLFKRKTGFCEHYAAAFASLMRLAGVPARVVTGYQGGELNEVGHFYVIRQSDAHAWCEVWVRGQGWLRVDPTSVIAPDRVNAGLGGFIEGVAGPLASPVSPGSRAALAWRDVLRRGRQYWDNVSYQWNLRVLAYDQDGQQSFFSSLGLGWLHPSLLLLGLALLSGIVLGVLWLWLRRAPHPRPRDPARRCYDRFCRRLARAGIPRRPAEGPLCFSQRAAGLLPAYAPALLEVGQLYAEVRYSSAPPPVAHLVRAVRALAPLHSRRATGSEPAGPPDREPTRPGG